MSFVELFDEDAMYAGKGVLGKLLNYKRKLMYNFILSNMPRDRNISILDIGSKDGAFLDFLRKHGYHNITAVDLEPSRKEILQGDITNLQFKDNSFDVVTVVGVLEHLFEPVKALNELKRVHSKLLFLNVPNEPWWSFFVGMKPPACHVASFTPIFLQHHLGKMYKSKIIFLKREFIGIWAK